jgi:spermidine export protein MdtJ
MTVYWLLLSCAVASNVLANIAFKITMSSIEGDLGPSNFMTAVTRGWFWVAVGASAVLLGSYLLALRQIGLAASYAVVTSSALVAISIASQLVFGERITVAKAIGIIAVVLGLFLIVREEIGRLSG